MAYPARLLVCSALSLGLGVPAVARAERPQQLSIATAGSCPSPDDIAEELRQLMPDATLDISPDAVDSDVIVFDRGAGFTVKVRGQRRRFRDARRDCLERARHVAVFTVLIVDPLRVPSNTTDDAEEEPDSAEKPVAVAFEPPAPRPAKAAETGARLDLSLGPIAQVAIKQNYSGEEIAEMQGIPLNTVWTRLHHARKEFLRLVSESGHAWSAK